MACIPQQVPHKRFPSRRPDDFFRDVKTPPLQAHSAKRILPTHSLLHFFIDSHLQKAVEINPQHIYHRLELAEVYVDLDQYSKAREQLKVIATLPNYDVLDHQYKDDAVALLDEIKNKKDKSS